MSESAATPWWRGDPALSAYDDLPKKCGVDGCEQPIGRCTVHCPCGYPWDDHPEGSK